MFGWSKKRSWKPEVLAELVGQERGLRVVLSNFPFLRDELTGDRKYAFKDFGNDFLMAFHDAIGGARNAHARLLSGSTISAVVRLPQQRPIGVELSGRPNDRVRTFESDIADALINAFQTVGLRSR